MFQNVSKREKETTEEQSKQLVCNTLYMEFGEEMFVYVFEILNNSKRGRGGQISGLYICTKIMENRKTAPKKR